MNISFGLYQKSRNFSNKCSKLVKNFWKFLQYLTKRWKFSKILSKLLRIFWHFYKNIQIFWHFFQKSTKFLIFFPKIFKIAPNSLKIASKCCKFRRFFWNFFEICQTFLWFFNFFCSNHLRNFENWSLLLTVRVVRCSKIRPIF